ncbi:hypothetical protein [Streptacidiphilus sp. MAP5-52]|uniref:hypothetical protein n=1 Tax=Streptacidiphilus sp. MAP5-52 TaxID=3156267 RepID=UPI0035122888
MITKRFARDVHQHGDPDQVLLDWDLGDTDETEREEAVLDIYRHNPVVWTPVD